MSTIQQSAVAAALDTLGATADHWTIDPQASTFEVRGRYLFGPAVSARFKVFSGSVNISDNRSAIGATLLIDASTLNSGISMRDKHARDRSSALDVERFPFIRFDLEHAMPGVDATFDITGNVTLRAVTRPVDLHVDAKVYAEHAHLSVTGNVDLRAFNIHTPLRRHMTVHARLRAIPQDETSGR